MNSRSRWAIFLVILLASGSGAYFIWHRTLHLDHPGHAGDKAAVKYTCPMHPFVVKDKPGACPICGMSLVPAGGGGDDGSELALPDAVRLSPAQMVMANVATAPVEEIPLIREVRAVGIVTYDQAKQAKVTAWVPGRIDRLYVNRVGDLVNRGRPVALLYAPELVSAQQEFLLALRSREELRRSRIPSIAEGGEGLVRSSRQRLKLWGLTEDQIASLEKNGEPAVQVPIHTPLSGVVVEKLVVEGQYVAEGEPLFSVADFSTVWVELALYENEFPAVAEGQEVAVASESYPGETFMGRVSYIYPFLDPQTRTLKVRVEIDNPGLRLKPDMYVEAALRQNLGRGYAVPVTAVIDTGRRKVVWVEEEKGVFMPREVKVGARVGGMVQVLEGVDDFDTVAVSGGYLIDSEAQLRGSGGGGHAGPGGAQAGGDRAKPDAGPAVHSH